MLSVHILTNSVVLSRGFFSELLLRVGDVVWCSVVEGVGAVVLKKLSQERDTHTTHSHASSRSDYQHQHFVSDSRDPSFKSRQSLSKLTSSSCGVKSSMMTIWHCWDFTQDYYIMNHVPRYKYDGSLNVNIAYHEEHRQFSSAVRAYHDIGKMKILDFLLRLMFSIDMFSKTKLYK